MIEFFEYKDGVCKINIDEYDYRKSEFNLRDETELQNFIKAINNIYDLCDEDRIRFNEDANDEYYKRDKIVSLVQEELNEQDRQLKNYPVDNDRIILRMLIMAKIEVLDKLKKEINELLY